MGLFDKTMQEKWDAAKARNAIRWRKFKIGVALFVFGVFALAVASMFGLFS